MVAHRQNQAISLCYIKAETGLIYDKQLKASKKV